jgi:hypothetical protein
MSERNTPGFELPDESRSDNELLQSVQLLLSQATEDVKDLTAEETLNYYLTDGRGMLVMRLIVRIAAFSDDINPEFLELRTVCRSLLASIVTLVPESDHDVIPPNDAPPIHEKEYSVLAKMSDSIQIILLVLISMVVSTISRPYVNGSVEAIKDIRVTDLYIPASISLLLLSTMTHRILTLAQRLQNDRFEDKMTYNK